MKINYKKKVRKVLGIFDSWSLSSNLIFIKPLPTLCTLSTKYKRPVQFIQFALRDRGNELWLIFKTIIWKHGPV